MLATASPDNEFADGEFVERVGHPRLARGARAPTRGIGVARSAIWNREAGGGDGAGLKPVSPPGRPRSQALPPALGGAARRRLPRRGADRPARSTTTSSCRPATCDHRGGWIGSRRAPALVSRPERGDVRGSALGPRPEGGRLDRQLGLRRRPATRRGASMRRSCAAFVEPVAGPAAGFADRSGAHSSAPLTQRRAFATSSPSPSPLPGIEVSDRRAWSARGRGRRRRAAARQPGVRRQARPRRGVRGSSSGPVSA